MKHLGLFEGIGGFSLAAEKVGWETVAWVEKEPFCQKVLNKNFPNAKGYGDIKEFNGKPYKGAIGIITGGFPCQPFSKAGKRKGESDERYLWGEMLRIIREIKPAFVVGENVSGIISMGNGETLETIHTDLESEGYKVQSFIIPACGIGAPHKRDRVWIIAYSDNFLQSGTMGRRKDNKEAKRSKRKDKCKRGTSFRQRVRDEPCHKNKNKSERQFNKQWHEIASKFCRMDDGISRRLDKDRSRRLKALGNAIVPQVAIEIFKILEQYTLNKPPLK